MGKAKSLFGKINEEISKPQEKARTLVHYLKQGRNSKPMQAAELNKNLNAGIYKIAMTMEGPVFTEHYFASDEIIRFEDARLDDITSEVEQFWKDGKKYAELGMTHTRGILVYGPPGTGKTILTRMIIEDAINKDVVVIIHDSPYTLQAGIAALREVEAKRPLLVIMEDMDNSMHSESIYLQLLDGDSKFDKVLYLGTTNYINKISPRMLRPGRFDRKIEIAMPPYEGRFAYLNAKLKDIGYDEATIRDMAEKTDGLSFAQLRELMVSHHIYGKPYDMIIDRLRNFVEESEGMTECEFNYLMSSESIND